jgi:hypothetical protein
LKPRYFRVLGPHFRFDQMLSGLQRPNALRMNKWIQLCSMCRITLRPPLDPLPLQWRLVFDNGSLLLGGHDDNARR